MSEGWEDEARDDDGRWEAGEEAGEKIYEENEWPSENLTLSQENAVSAYVNEDYPINETLRGEGDSSGVDEVLTISAIDGAISAQDPSTQDQILFRGVDSEIADQYGNLQPGDVFTDQGFISTTTGADTATLFTGEEAGGRVLEIQAPSGTQGLNVSTAVSSVSASSSGENEVLLARGSQFEVISHEGSIEDMSGNTIPITQVRIV